MAYGLASLYEYTSIPIHARARLPWLISVSSGARVRANMHRKTR
jgi:hypothetical protein